MSACAQSRNVSRRCVSRRFGGSEVARPGRAQVAFSACAVWLNPSLCSTAVTIPSSRPAFRQSAERRPCPGGRWRPRRSRLVLDGVEHGARLRAARGAAEVHTPQRRRSGRATVCYPAGRARRSARSFMMPARWCDRFGPPLSPLCGGRLSCSCLIQARTSPSRLLSTMAA